MQGGRGPRMTSIYSHEDIMPGHLCNLWIIIWINVIKSKPQIGEILNLTGNVWGRDNNRRIHAF